MTTRRTTIIPFLPLLLLACSASAPLAAIDLDALFIHQDTHDILILRPWLEDPPDTGVWLWPVPPGTEVSIKPDIPIDDMRSAVWMGHVPLSKPNTNRLQSYCEMIEYGDLMPMPVQALGSFGSLPLLKNAASGTGVSLTEADRKRCRAILAAGDHVGAVAWRGATNPAQDRNHAGLVPLAAIVSTAPASWGALPLGSTHPMRGCLGRLMAVAAQPLVPAPDERRRWGVSLLVGNGAPTARNVAGLAGASDVDDTWAVTALDLKECDETTVLHLEPLDPFRDLVGAAARTAASWCGLHPDATHAAALRQVLADPQRTSRDAAFALWAWAQQKTNDTVPVLESWRGNADPFVRSEALLELAAVDTVDVVARDLDILAAFLEPTQEVQRTVDRTGFRLVNADLRDHVPRLETIADEGGGWFEWLMAEQVDQMAKIRVQRGPRPYRPSGDGLTAGAWAVAALATTANGDAVVLLPRILVDTAIFTVAATKRPRRGCFRRQGITSDFWNGYQILFPRESSRLWPTLHRLEVALNGRPRVRDSLIRIALRDPRLPDVAATVLLASLVTWYPQDEERAVAILASTESVCDARQTRFIGMVNRQIEIDVELPWAAAGAAYVLAQRGATTPILDTLERTSDAALRRELVFALALAEKRSEAARDATAAWRAETADLADGEPDQIAATLAAERIDAARNRGPRHRRPYSARFDHDFRPPWLR